MPSTWVVTANASRARIFSQAGRMQPLEEINDMIDEASRLRTADTETDRLGPTGAAKSSHGGGAAMPANTYEPQQTPAAHAMESFARQVADFLLQGRQQGRYEALQLVASPQFLGVLRKLLDPQLKALVKVEINKDYTQASPLQLREQIAAHPKAG